MGLFDAIKGLLGAPHDAHAIDLPLTGSSADVRGLLVDNAQGALTLESLAPANHERGRSRGEEQGCAKCGKVLEPVVFTTYGGSIWAERPMALDGWRCRSCGHLSGPAWLTVDEVAALERAGAEAGQDGRLDEAELHFRRILGSWAGYPMAALNLASVYMDRIQQEGNSPEQELRYKRVVEAEMRRAAAGDPVPHPFVFRTLTRICAFRGDEAEAWQWLEKLETDPRSGAPELEEAKELRTYLDGLGWLFDRATDCVRDITFAEPRHPLPIRGEPAARLRDAAADLERFSARHPDHWQCRFFLGKAQEALGDLDAAVRWLTEANELDHHNPHVGRELASVFLQSGRVEDAVFASRAALALAPQDDGLLANLALSLMMAGEDVEAREAMGFALELAPDDPINQRLSALIEAVIAGESERPTRLGPGGKLPS